MKSLNPLKKLDIACFLRSQLYLAPVLLLFYQQNGLTIADYVMFQGIFQLTGIIFVFWLILYIKLLNLLVYC